MGIWGSVIIYILFLNVDMLLGILFLEVIIF
jgi:hypothetical protein